ncbi:hypothetical protein N657DRAFT_406048 [Parathielavia appendiculata]|uniref:Uncharacterized protein n=1 Tax=Parathielavia appendiculata TaxID=2587402 RepID=A0AAN6TP89_9PEZI|nr:hypothetical protein N657DRAFT_406048 [Parathielavia appendiculata]
MDTRDPSCSAPATTSGWVLPVVSVANALHPDAAWHSRKRTRDGPGEEREVVEVSRERSTSRHREVEESGFWKFAYLRRKIKEAQMIEDGKRVEKPIKQRGTKNFCHKCKKQQVFKDISCTQCGHDKCLGCLVALRD